MRKFSVSPFNCESPEALRAHVAGFVSSIGLDSFGFAALLRGRAGAPSELQILASVGDPWEAAIRQAVKTGSAQNSIRHAALFLPPVGWSAAGDIVGHTILDEFALEQIRRISQWGIRSGILCPVYAPELDWGFLAFYSGEELDHSRLSELLAPCHLYASNFIFWYLQLAVRKPSGIVLQLSPRESECLGAASRGLTSAAIGEELGIARRTVEAHIASACAKLNARGRREAIAIATNRKLIGGDHALRDEYQRQRDEHASQPTPSKIDRP